jgi:NAD(P)-dependent dehydrogenase (short-subunit alcohol dehydrogenase family)
VPQLEGHVAVVTGAAQGIGRALALGLGREGASVVVADTNGDGALRVQDELAELGVRGLAVPTDVSDEDAVQTMVQRCLREFGRVDILVNDAGIYPISPVETMTEEEWDRVVGVNLIGAFLCSRAVVPTLIAQRRGRIISLTSGLGLQGAANGAHYAASKAGLIGFTKSLALELAPYGITVNALCPGVTDTAQPRGHMTDEELYARAGTIPLSRIGQPEDLVAPTLFLASEAARFVTGQMVIVNGGAIMW